MPFNSFNFWLIFPFIFGLYWLIPAKYNQARKVFLVLVSYLLYMNWKPAFAIVLLGVTLITYWGGLRLDNQKAVIMSARNLMKTCWCSVLQGQSIIMFQMSLRIRYK